jgi:hypothetical protein
MREIEKKESMYQSELRILYWISGVTRWHREMRRDWYLVMINEQEIRGVPPPASGEGVSLQMKKIKE